jgi:pyruvyltransferase
MDKGLFKKNITMIKIVHWKCRKNNWGDGIAPFIAEKMSGQKVQSVTGLEQDLDIRYSVTGSINQWLTNNNTILWGTGFISETSKLSITPKDIRAVRGPLTREKFLKFGVECPEVYGDPALLMPKFYFPRVAKKYKYGIIPHYVDVNQPWVRTYKDNPDVKIISITHKTEEELYSHRFIKEILECEIIFSSSLHGLIAADAYGIPSHWIELSNGVIGNGFKFHDYFMSVKRPIVKPFKPTENTKISNLPLYDYSVDIDLDKLINSCPFKK